MVSERFKDLAQPLLGQNATKTWSWLASVAVLGGMIGAAVAWGVQSTVDQEYRSAAVFTVKDIAPDMPFLSLNEDIEAEQTMDVLRVGPAKRLATAAAPAGAKYRTAWVAGKKRGDMAFRVTSTDAKLAYRLARVVYDAAGPGARALLDPAGPRPVIDAKEVTKASARYTTGAKVVGISAAVGAAVAGGSCLVAILSPGLWRRKTTASSPAR